MKIHHICIQISTYEKSLAFYRGVLGFDLVQVSEDFHTRDYNTWLDLNGFMIELQTAKVGQPFSAYNKNSQGVPHFCLYSDAFDEDYIKIKSKDQGFFRQKNHKDIYQVEGGRLFKVVAPEGTIIEIRDSESL